MVRPESTSGGSADAASAFMVPMGLLPRLWVVAATPEPPNPCTRHTCCRRPVFDRQSTSICGICCVQRGTAAARGAQVMPNIVY